MTPATITFKPKQTTKKLLKNLHDRVRHVLVHRFGLEGDGTKRTLDAIGKEFGITRERVRQIEKFGIQAIKKSTSFAEAEALVAELKKYISEAGGIVEERFLLEMLSKDPVIQNHINFYLVLGEPFRYHKEDEHFKGRWVVESQHADRIHQALKDLHQALGDTLLMHEDELVNRILAHEHVSTLPANLRVPERAKEWLFISRQLGKNPLGEWGQMSSPHIKTRGVRDMAYLVMRRHGSPMHFSEVARAIEESFHRPIHIATTHNELIKDDRFVLVGRGVYALKEWGYKAGVVRDVIAEILKREGPMTREDIVDRVLKERYLKRNTILVNLQKKYFKKDEQGRYFVAS